MRYAAAPRIRISKSRPTDSSRPMRRGPSTLRGLSAPTARAIVSQMRAMTAKNSADARMPGAGWVVAADRIDIRVIRFRLARRSRRGEFCASTPMRTTPRRGAARIVGFPAEFSMSTILEEIVAAKHQEVADRKARVPLEQLKETISTLGRPRNFFHAVTNPGTKALNLIAEVKKASPSAGVI